MKSPIAPTIGIVSSLGLSASARFLDLLHEECRTQYGAERDSECPRVLLSCRPGHGDETADAVRNGLRQLERAGAGFLAVAGDEAILRFGTLAEAVGVRVLNPVDLLLDAIPPSAQTLALAATRPVVASEILQRALRHHRLRLVDPGWQEAVDALFANGQYAATRWKPLLAQAAEAGADAILVAGFGPAGTPEDDGVQVIDVTRCLAKGIVAEWLAWCVEE